MTFDHFKYLRFQSLQRAFFFEFESAEHLLFLLAGFILVCVCFIVLNWKPHPFMVFTHQNQWL